MRLGRKSAALVRRPWLNALLCLTPVLLLLGALPAAAAAQAYPQLHVIALSQRADRATVEPAGVFHLTIHVKIAQRRDRLDELILGSFENCEIISNETVRTAVPDGTDFVERLSVQALAPGEAMISPAYLDAIDPALGRAMRYSSNAVSVRVLGAAPYVGLLRGAEATARRLLLALAIVASVVAAAFVLAVLFVRRRRRPAKIAPAAVTPDVPIGPPPGTPATNEALVRAAERFGVERSAAALMAVRALLFGLAGVPAGATLVDALGTLGERDRGLRPALLAAEAAAFGPVVDRPAAGNRLLAAIQAYTGGQAANEDAWTR